MTGFPLQLPLDGTRPRAMNVYENAPGCGFSLNIQILTAHELTAVRDFLENLHNTTTYLRGVVQK